jgi:hypothetical protein
VLKNKKCVICRTAGDCVTLPFLATNEEKLAMDDIFLYPERPKVKRDLTGIRFGRLIVINLLGKSQRSGKILWACLCDCGRVTFPETCRLTNGMSRSCGCLRVEACKKNFTTHGASVGKVFDREYITWNSMLQRCKSGNATNRHLYRDKGILVCDRWRYGEDGKEGYTCFLEDMGKKPTYKHSIDRIDSNKNYEPSNCRWATSKEQARNLPGVVKVLFRGQEIIARQLCDEYGANGSLVLSRLKNGWDIEEALFTPLGGPRRKYRKRTQ